MKKWMEPQKSGQIRVVLFLLLVIGCPYFITMRISGKADRGTVSFLEKEKREDYRVLLSEGGEQKTLPLEEYILGVIPAYLSGEEIEADKAMAVLVRTYLYNQMVKKKTTILSAEELFLTYLSAEERKILWEGDFTENYQRVQKAVSDTAEEVLVIGEGEEKQVVYPYFHTLSAGCTRGREDASYLKEAVCKEDKTADGFLSLLVFQKEETLDKLAVLGYRQTEADFSEIRCEYGKEPYIERVILGDWSASAEDFQKTFGLRSTAFEIEAYRDGIRILTRGCGLGYGASLHMIQEFAVQGKSYQEILAVFFSAEVGNFQICE